LTVIVGVHCTLQKIVFTMNAINMMNAINITF